MKQLLWRALLGCLLLTACQTSAFARSTIAADGRIIEIVGPNRVPAGLLRSNGISFGSDDVVLNNGARLDVNRAIPAGEPISLELVRARPVLINGDPLLTAANTVGEAVRESGLELYAADSLDPPAETPVDAGMIISVGRAISIQTSADGTLRGTRTSDPAIGASLADAGIPLEGLDLATPSETDVPADHGEARLARVIESVVLGQEPIPFENVTTDSAEMEFGLEQIVHPGASGMAVTVTRIRLEDGAEVSRETGARTVVIKPQDRVLVRGTKLVEKTETVDGVSITYWRKLQMYATVYSPCNSGSSDGACSSGTASGRPAGKGVVAVDPSLYAYLNGQRLYIPGYGFAVVGDIGGGYIIEQNLGISRYKWIDLGFDDNNIQDMTGWLSVYFLAPAPAALPDVLR